MAFMDEDRDALLADFGVDVTVGADTVKGLYDLDELIGEAPEGLQLAGTEELVVAIAPLPASFVRDATITVEGVGSRVIRKLAPWPPDGRFTAMVVA